MQSPAQNSQSFWTHEIRPLYAASTGVRWMAPNILESRTWQMPLPFRFHRTAMPPFFAPIFSTVLVFSLWTPGWTCQQALIPEQPKHSKSWSHWWHSNHPSTNLVDVTHSPNHQECVTSHFLEQLKHVNQAGMLRLFHSRFSNSISKAGTVVLVGCSVKLIYHSVDDLQSGQLQIWSTLAQLNTSEHMLSSSFIIFHQSLAALRNVWLNSEAQDICLCDLIHEGHDLCLEHLATLQLKGNSTTFWHVLACCHSKTHCLNQVQFEQSTISYISLYYVYIYISYPISRSNHLWILTI